MPGEFSDAGSAKALDAVTGRATVTAATKYLALLTAAPSDTTTPATMTEYAATGYSRQAVEWDAPALNGSSIQETKNTNVETFGPFTAGTGATITHVALVTSSSGTTGTIDAIWTLDNSRTPGTNDSLQIAAGALKLTCD
jgi:hypothetical protein